MANKRKPKHVNKHANPLLAEAMRLLRRSSAASPHADNKHNGPQRARTRTNAKRKAINDQHT